MGRKKELLVRSVNFGNSREPARILLERFEKKHGKREVSNLVRKAIVALLSQDSQFKAFKAEILKEERRTMIKDLNKLSKKMQENADDLIRFGVDIDQIGFKDL